MRITRNFLCLPGILLFCLIGLGSAQVSASTGTYVPNIVDPSLPQFTNDVRVRANRGKWTIQGNRDFSFDTSSTVSWNGTGIYKLQATFDNSGAFLGGTVSLTGKIPGLVDHRQLLMSAELGTLSTDFGASADGMILGFNTYNIFCNPLLGVTCTDNESVLVYLDSMFGGDVTGRFRATGMAVTSVPVPGAILLFISGLGWLATTARRKVAMMA